MILFSWIFSSTYFTSPAWFMLFIKSPFTQVHQITIRSHRALCILFDFNLKALWWSKCSVSTLWLGFNMPLFAVLMLSILYALIFPLFTFWIHKILALRLLLNVSQTSLPIHQLSRDSCCKIQLGEHFLKSTDRWFDTL